MSTKDSSISVIDIAPAQVERATEVLALAFQDYPLMHYFFSDQGERYHSRLRDNCRLSCEWRLALRWPILGVMQNNQLVAVACATGIESLPDPTHLVEREQAFDVSIGAQAVSRIEQYAQVKKVNRSKEPHFYLGIIGVHPDSRRRGHAGALLNRLHAISETHPASTGVGLDTQIAANVPLYEHYGYQVTAKTHVGNVDTWFMFRPNGAHDVRSVT